ncbi:hypothetical protein [Bdellovibrio sp. HCB288]|uniref:hypothetical protein n=1 Tax=Bdellovibrio sp. HCB288 TaxID=3394355 RepID=UPI0039B5FB5D
MEQPNDHRLNEQNWSQVTQEVRKKWANLNESDIERIEHDYSSLTDLVSLKTGLTHEETEQRLDDIIARCGTETTINEVEASASWKRPPEKKAGTQDSGTIEEDSDEQAP